MTQPQPAHTWYTRKNCFIAGGVVLAGVVVFVIYKKWWTQSKQKSIDTYAKLKKSASKTKTAEAAKETTPAEDGTKAAPAAPQAGAGAAPAGAGAGGGAGGGSAGTGGAGNTGQQNTGQQTGQPQVNSLNEDYSDICDMDEHEYQHILRISTEHPVMEARNKYTSEIEQFPVIIQKNNTTRYVKITCRPKISDFRLYGFYKNQSNEVEMSVKLAATKVGSGDFQIKINKRITQYVRKLNQIEIHFKDAHSIAITINGEDTIPLFVSGGISYFILESDRSVKYYENDKKL